MEAQEPGILDELSLEEVKLFSVGHAGPELGLYEQEPWQQGPLP